MTGERIGVQVPVDVRPSLETDMAAVTAIYADAVLNGTATFEIDPPTVGTMTERREALLSGGFPYFVAERSGTVLGYAYAGPYRPRPAYRWTVEDSVYIAPAARGRGIGRALLERLIAECEGKGFRLMVAVIGDAASHASIALHRTMGFCDAGIHEGIGFKHGRWLATVQMQRPLGEGTSTSPV